MIFIQEWRKETAFFKYLINSGVCISVSKLTSRFKGRPQASSTLRSGDIWKSRESKRIYQLAIVVDDQ